MKNVTSDLRYLMALALAGLLTLVAAGCGGSGEGDESSGAGSEANEVAGLIEQLPEGATEGETGELIGVLGEELGDGPVAAETLSELGDALYQRGRETSDGAYVDLAEVAYRNALEEEPASPLALTGLATIELIKHDFQGGLELARQARAAAPELAAPYIPEIDGLIETGDYRGAARSIEELLDLKPGFAAYARLSYFEQLNGNERAAERAMREAAEVSIAGSEPRAFAVNLLGDLHFENGRYADAAEAYQGALNNLAGYPPAEAGMLNVAAAEGRIDEAIEGYRRLVDEDGLDEYADELGRLEEVDGQADEAEAHYAILRELHREELDAGQQADSGQVIFDADHGDPDFAVELGRKVWEESPSVSSADAYAWALYRAGDIGRAAEISRKAMRLGTELPLFRFHAGMIAAAAGDDRRASRILGGLLEESPRFDPLFADEAERELRRIG